MASASPCWRRISVTKRFCTAFWLCFSTESALLSDLTERLGSAGWRNILGIEEWGSALRIGIRS